MQLTDTHCHIHEASVAKNKDDPTHALWLKAEINDGDELIHRATEKEVTRLICVGTTANDSQRAVEFAQTHSNVWASVGLHPHEAKFARTALPVLQSLLSSEPPQDLVAGDGEEGTPPTRSGTPRGHGGRSLSGRTRDAFVGVGIKKIVAIGECGLDYFYNHSDKHDQEAALRAQIELAIAHDLPLIFHVREAFDDFWPIFDSYKGLRGVLHSFTDSQANLAKALERDLFIGVNGIMTFTKEQSQLDMARAIPLTKLLLETDAPFLTPVPFRGRVNEPAHVRLVAEFMAHLRGEPLAELANHTSANAQSLFRFK
ncbi:MAG TPA: TatD family hydrolase [Candidatus Saccharimonadales bacterium]|nr:TatD family hydrolase [Candidatus Saccharimonadales bacterium]